jgi:hypothetical protein
MWLLVSPAEASSTGRLLLLLLVTVILVSILVRFRHIKFFLKCVKVEAKNHEAANAVEKNERPESGDILAQKEKNANTAGLIKRKV